MVYLFYKNNNSIAGKDKIKFSAPQVNKIQTIVKNLFFFGRNTT